MVLSHSSTPQDALLGSRSHPTPVYPLQSSNLQACYGPRSAGQKLFGLSFQNSMISNQKSKREQQKFCMDQKRERAASLINHGISKQNAE